MGRNGGSRDFSYVLSSRCAAMFFSYASSYLVDPLPQPRTRSIGELGKGSREWYSTYTEIIRSHAIPCFFFQIKLLLLCKHKYPISFSPLVSTKQIVYATKRNETSPLFSCYVITRCHRGVSKNDRIVCRLNKTNNLNKSAIRIEAQGRVCLPVFKLHLR